MTGDKGQPTDIVTRIRAKAAECGFVACGIARADAAPRTAELANFIGAVAGA